MDELFENTENAFALKSDSELERAYFLFKMIANEPLVQDWNGVANFADKHTCPWKDLFVRLFLIIFAVGSMKKIVSPS